MRSFRKPVRGVAIAVLAVACGGRALHEPDVDGGGDAAPRDATAEDSGSMDAGRDSAPETGAVDAPVDSFVALDAGTETDAFLSCPSSLPPDAGPLFLDQLPVASLCGAYMGFVLETAVCDGTIEVMTIDLDGDGPWWIFDAQTGALEATGLFINDCTGAVPGFQPPRQCYFDGGYSTQQFICADAGELDGGSGVEAGE